MPKCEYCDKFFSHRANKYRHVHNTCHKRPDRLSKHTQKPRSERIRIDIRPKNQPSRSEIETIKQCLVEIKQQNQDIQEKLNKQAEQKGGDNYNIYNNYIIIGPDVYSNMVQKFGKEETLRMLTSGNVSDNTLKIIKKVYLDGVAPEQYPIACRNNDHFRYLNDKHELIDDLGGQKCQDFVTNRVHNAMLMATNEVINQVINGSNQSDIGNLQQNLTAKVKNKTVISDLANMTRNPNHPFFRDSLKNK